MPKAIRITSEGVYVKEVPELTEEEAAAQEEARLIDASRDQRSYRDFLLADSDWTQVADSALTDEQKAAWATYRTSLRNLPDHENWPDLEDDDWPTKPS